MCVCHTALPASATCLGLHLHHHHTPCLHLTLASHLSTLPPVDVLCCVFPLHSHICCVSSQCVTPSGGVGMMVIVIVPVCVCVCVIVVNVTMCNGRPILIDGQLMTQVDVPPHHLGPSRTD